MSTLDDEFRKFKGRNFFRQRLILSCFSRKKIIIEEIKDGIKDYEKDFLNLLNKITNGSIITINDTAKVVRFSPGILHGTDQPIEFNCSPSRGIGYFLEPLFILAPFCKYPLDIKLKGITNNDIDPTFDMIKYSLFAVLKKFLVSEGLKLQLIRRGLPPKGNGLIHFVCPVCKTLQAFQWQDMGKVKKIRGTVFTCNVTPTVGNRVMESAKKIFNNVLTDVYFTIDNSHNSKLSPGYGLCCMGETHKGSVYCAEVVNCGGGDKNESNTMTPETLGEKAAQALLEEIYKGGVIDTLAQPLVISFMVFGPKDISKVVFGPLSNYTMNYMSLINDFFNVKFQIDPHKEQTFLETKKYKTGAPKLLLTCLGIGFTNVNKPQI